MINLSQVVGGQLNRSGTEVLLESMTLCRSRNRHDPGFLGEQPCKRDLRWRSLLPFRELLQPLDKCEIRGAILGVKRGTTFRVSVLSNVVLSSILPVRNPRPRGLKGTNPIPNSSSTGKTS